jgi:hypothetical protein
MSDPGAGTLVYLGPTMLLADAQAILPGATFCPPVEQGDVFSLLGEGQPDAIAIVDGVFYQQLPVWHKEIIAALERGVAVYGASSMGALRAAECGPYGMVGVGVIFDAYASGELVDDDEVAVAHDGPESGWRTRTEPMVNVRATVRSAVAEGKIGGAAAMRVITVAKSIWFADRTRQKLLRALLESGLPAAEVEALRAAFHEAYVDQKRLDAVALLRLLAARSPGQDRATAEVAGCPMFLAFADRDRKVAHDGVVLRLEEIARYAALHERGFAELRDRALDRILTNVLARVWDIQVSDDEIASEAQRLRVRLGLAHEESLQRWLRANDVDAGWFSDMARREAVARRLRDWARVVRGKRLLVGPVLDELRLSGRYEQVAAEASTSARLRSPLDPAPHWTTGPDNEQRPDQVKSRVVALLRDQLRATGWRPDVPLSSYADEAGFAELADLLDELVAARAVRVNAARQLDLLKALLGTEGEP